MKCFTQFFYWRRRMSRIDDEQPQAGLEGFYPAARGCQVQYPLNDSPAISQIHSQIISEPFLIPQHQAGNAGQIHNLRYGLGGKGNFYPPTVLAEIPGAAPAFREEVFGPVAMLFRVKDATAAVAIVLMMLRRLVGMDTKIISAC
jgi:acyl-CoA reductase-like NAD-dependent aldehyde dehydrogenase